MTTTLNKNQHEFINDLGGSSPIMVFAAGWDNIKPTLWERLTKVDKTTDLDISCAMYDRNQDRVDCVWYAQLASKCGAVRHRGDDTVGTDDHDDETIQLDLNQLDENITTVVFVISAFSPQAFSNIATLYWRLFDGQTKREIARARVGTQTRYNAKIVLRMQKHEKDGLVQWSVKALDEEATGQNIQEVFPEIRSLLED